MSLPAMNYQASLSNSLSLPCAPWRRFALGSCLLLGAVIPQLIGQDAVPAIPPPADASNVEAGSSPVGGTAVKDIIAPVPVPDGAVPSVEAEISSDPTGLVVPPLPEDPSFIVEPGPPNDMPLGGSSKTKAPGNVILPSADTVNVPKGDTIHSASGREITLGEALRITVAQQPQIQLAKEDVRIAEAKLGIMKSVFDPIFVGEIQYAHERQPYGSSIIDSQRRARSATSNVLNEVRALRESEAEGFFQLESTQAGLLRQIIRRDTFVAERIALDRQLLADFYQDRGYVDFEVLSVTPELARGRDAYFVTFNIREGQSFSLGEITTVSEIAEVDAAQYQDAMRIRPGQTYSPRLIDATISRLEALATQQGLRFVRVEPRITRNDEDRTLAVAFVISRGERIFVERIDIEGNVTTLDSVIRRYFTSVEGDPFDPRAIRQAAERIRATGFFADASVEARPGTAADQVIVDVDVEEQPTGSLGFSVSFSTDTGAGLAVNFSESNFLGRGQALSFAFNTTDGSQDFNFNFTEPRFRARDLALNLGAFYTETSTQNRNFDTLDVGLRAGLGFPIGEFSRMTVTYGLEQNEVSGLDVASSSPILVAEQGDRIASYVGLQYSYETRNVGLDPTRGVRLQFGLDYAGLGGDAEYLRATLLGIAERQVLREEVTLRASFEAGAIETLNGNSRLSDRFFLSSRQMRGFDAFGLGPRDTAATNEDALGGNLFSVARFEASFPLGLPDEYGISGGVFYDIGSVWGLDNTLGAGGAGDLVDDSLRLRSSIGVSIFWNTAIGPLRFNFSQPLTFESYDRTREFDLTVETRF